MYSQLRYKVYTIHKTASSVLYNTSLASYNHCNSLDRHLNAQLAYVGLSV